MMTTSAYQGWYDNIHTNQPIPHPIDNTLEGIKALLEDEDVDDSHKAAAAQFLKRTQYKNTASNCFAAICALGAAFSSMAYLLLMRGHSLDWDEWEYLIAPAVIGLFVAGATWYTYRHDTAEWMLDFKFHLPKTVDSKDICIAVLTLLVVAMEIALAGYGVTELGLGNTETAVVWLICFATLIPEWAQTHKYLEKWIRSTGEDKETFEGSKKNWLNFYRLCSVITLGFWGMAIFPLIEDYTNTAFAGCAVAFYVLLGKPYMKEKAKDQVNDQFASTSTSTTTNHSYWYPIARIGNGIGDLAFSAYGFFEALKAFDLIKEDEKVRDTFKFEGDGCYETWAIIVSAVIVVTASSIGSFLMSAGGDHKSYGEKIEEVQKVIPKDVEGRPPPAGTTVLFSSMWHQPADIPKPADVKKLTPT